MEPPPAPPLTDLAYQLPRDAYWQTVQTLHTSLPPPASDDPQAIARRQRAAIAQVASLLPVTAAEAQVAARSVAADAQAHECLRLARLSPADADRMLRCNAQAASMWRLADSAIRLLQRMQATRTKRDADPAAADQAAWAEHCALGLMTDALHDDPPVPAPTAAPPPPAEPTPEPARDPLAEAELYATVYPERSALIRRAGGMPDGVTFGPPDDHIVQGLVTGRTPALLALDQVVSHHARQRLAQRHTETVP